MSGGWEKPSASLEDACRRVQVVCRRSPSRGRWCPADAVDGDRVGKGAGRVFLFPDGSGGIVVNWRTGERALFFYDAKGPPLSESELSRRRRAAAAAMRRLDAERLRREEKAARRASELMRMARRAEFVGHGYLERKGVPPEPLLGVLDALEIQAFFNESYGDGARTLWDVKAARPMRGPVLLVPLFAGLRLTRVSSIEFISETGGKYTLPEARASGALWFPEAYRIGAARPRAVGVAEGLATALSVSRVNGFPVAAARACGNLRAAALVLRERFPGVPLIVFGDVGNGSDSARAAARAAAAPVRFPTFTPETVARFRERTGSTSAPTDWNDYYLAEGML